MTLCQRFPLTLIAVALALLPIDMLAGPPPGQLTLEPYTFSSRGKANDVAIVPGPGAGGRRAGGRPQLVGIVPSSPSDWRRCGGPRTADDTVTRERMVSS